MKIYMFFLVVVLILINKSHICAQEDNTTIVTNNITGYTNTYQTGYTLSDPR